VLIFFFRLPPRGRPGSAPLVRSRPFDRFRRKKGHPAPSGEPVSDASFQL